MIYTGFYRGRVGLLTPFTYYQFLVQRYASRRNPYTRNMFRELRVLFESIAYKQTTPGFIKQALLAMVNFTCKLAPIQMAAPQQSQWLFYLFKCVVNISIERVFFIWIIIIIWIQGGDRYNFSIKFWKCVYVIACEKIAHPLRFFGIRKHRKKSFPIDLYVLR